MKPMGFDRWFFKGGVHKTEGVWWMIFQRGDYMKPMGFKGWFFKGGSTWNRWALMGDFSKGGVHETEGVLMGDFSKGGVHETDGSWWVLEKHFIAFKKLSARGVYCGKDGIFSHYFRKLVCFLLTIHSVRGIAVVRRDHRRVPVISGRDYCGFVILGSNVVNSVRFAMRIMSTGYKKFKKSKKFMPIFNLQYFTNENFYK